MSFRNTRAGAGDFALGASVAGGILAVLFALVTFSEQIVRAFY